jgi:hypothetical protein
MKITLTVDQASIRNVTRNLQQKMPNVKVAARQGVNNAAEKVFQKAQERVPVMTGALRDSGRLTSKGDDTQPQSIISYGNDVRGYKGVPTREYALPRHEIFSRLKPESYKWLERSLLEANEEFKEEVIRLLSEALRK